MTETAGMKGYTKKATQQKRNHSDMANKKEKLVVMTQGKKSREAGTKKKQKRGNPLNLIVLWLSSGTLVKHDANTSTTSINRQAAAGSNIQD